MFDNTPCDFVDKDSLRLAAEDAEREWIDSFVLTPPPLHPSLWQLGTGLIDMESASETESYGSDV